MQAEHLYWPQLTPIERIERETPDTATYFLNAEKIPWRKSYLPGQFAELSVFGVGEAPFCLCQSATRADFIELTIRKTGALTNLLQDYEVGDLVGLRGPFGNSFHSPAALGKDLVFVAGGIGLPPLRSFINYALDHRDDYGRIYVLYGARGPADLVYKNELAAWQRSDKLTLALTVDRGDETWQGKVGLVTELVAELSLAPESTMAFTCGPPIMLNFVRAALKAKGLEDKQIITSLERYMKCGVGKCGHCCVGHHYLCTDGPIYSFEQIRHLPEEA